jgi:hypothetical protein
MEDRRITVRAYIRLLPGCQGSRQGKWRPNHNFLQPGDPDPDMAIGQIDVPEGTALHPGESIERVMTFLYGPRLDGLIMPGREWRIQEGPHLVGIGTILEILP